METMEQKKTRPHQAERGRHGGGSQFRRLRWATLRGEISVVQEVPPNEMLDRWRRRRTFSSVWCDSRSSGSAPSVALSATARIRS
jgi:hypothetical protein